jgi:hypothetical protein
MAFAQTPPPPPVVAADGAAALTLIGSTMGYVWGALPGVVIVIGGIMAIGWYALQYWESKTFSGWRERRQARRKIEKIARLKAQEKVITAQLEALELKRSAASTAAEVLRVAESAATEKIATATAEAAVEKVKSTTAAAVEQVTKS